MYRCGQDEAEERKDEEEDEKERRKKEQERSKAEIAEQLLQLGAKAGAKELKGEQTPLHLAAMNGMEQVQCIPINKRIIFFLSSILFQFIYETINSSNMPKFL